MREFCSIPRARLRSGWSRICQSQKSARALDVEHVAVAAPNSDTAIVANVHFGLVAGEAVAIELEMT